MLAEKLTKELLRRVGHMDFEEGVRQREPESAHITSVRQVGVGLFGLGPKTQPSELPLNFVPQSSKRREHRNWNE